MPSRILNALRGAWTVVLAGLRHDRDLAGRDLAVSGDDAREAGQVGLPHFFTDVRIADERGRMVPRGTRGRDRDRRSRTSSRATERPARGDGRGAFTARRMVPLRRPGLPGCRRLPRCISDRLKDMIISGGENIYPAEIENLIADIEDVTGVAVHRRSRREGARSAGRRAAGGRRRRRHRVRAGAPRRAVSRATSCPRSVIVGRAARHGIGQGSQGRPASALRDLEPSAGGARLRASCLELRTRRRRRARHEAADRGMPSRAGQSSPMKARRESGVHP